MANTPKHSTMFNFRINTLLWKQLREAVKDGGHFTFAQFVRDAIKEKIAREKAERDNG